VLVGGFFVSEECHTAWSLCVSGLWIRERVSHWAASCERRHLIWKISHSYDKLASCNFFIDHYIHLLWPINNNLGFPFAAGPGAGSGILMLPFPLSRFWRFSRFCSWIVSKVSDALLTNLAPLRRGGPLYCLSPLVFLRPLWRRFIVGNVEWKLLLLGSLCREMNFWVVCAQLYHDTSHSTTLPSETTRCQTRWC
jgi:hypothetical protein